MVASGKVNVKKLVTHHFDIEQTQQAFDTAKSGTGNPIKIMIHCNNIDLWTIHANEFLYCIRYDCFVLIKATQKCFLEQILFAVQQLKKLLILFALLMFYNLSLLILG